MASVKELFDIFNENSIVFVVFLVALVTIILFFKDKQAKELLVYPALVVLLVVLNPLVIEIGTKFFAITRVVRLYWLFPITVVLAYVCVRLVEHYGKKCVEYIVVMILLLGVIVGTGKYMFSHDNFLRAENIYKLPDETIAICEAIEQDGYNGILVPSIELVDTIRQYDAQINMAYGRNSRGIYTGIGEVLNQPTIEVELINEYFATEEYGYLLINKNKELNEALLDQSFCLLLETEEHWLYKYADG